MANCLKEVTIQPKTARLTHDTAIFKMDPYCVVWLGNQSARTVTHHDGGRTPHWNDVLTLFRDQEDCLRFLIYDRVSVEADAFVAEGYFYFNTYLGGVFEQWIPLQYEGRSAGELHVNIMIQPGAVQEFPREIQQRGYISAGPAGSHQPVVIIEEGRPPRHGERLQEVIYTQQAGASTQPSNQQPVRAVVMDEGQHHQGDKMQEVIYTQQAGASAQAANQQPVRAVIIEEGRHHQGDKMQEAIFIQPGQQMPVQPYPGQHTSYEQYPNQPHYPHGHEGFRA